MQRAIPVIITPNDPRLNMYEAGEGVIIGYIKKGDYYTTEVLQFLGMEITTPIVSEFEVFIIKRLDKNSSVIVQRSDLGNLVTLKNVTDYNYVQEIYQNPSFFNPALAGLRKESRTKTKKEKLQAIRPHKKCKKKKSLLQKVWSFFSAKKAKRKKAARGAGRADTREQVSQSE